MKDSIFSIESYLQEWQSTTETKAVGEDHGWKQDVGKAVTGNQQQRPRYKTATEVNHKISSKSLDAQ
jgi:hypothetical protein